MGEVGAWEISERKKRWAYQPPTDCSWYRKKLYFVKELFKEGCTNMVNWDRQGKDHYKVKLGCHWLQGKNPKVAWAKVLWSRTIIPRHAFILWTFIKHRLPTKQRLSKYSLQLDTTCFFYNVPEESDIHIIYECPYAQDV